jgi:hypothetical protein
MIPTLLGALVVLLGLIVKPSKTVSYQVVLCLLGGAAAMFLPALGGATITVPVAFLPFAVWKAWRHSNGPLREGVISKAAFYLCVAVIIGAVNALVIPRLFAGETSILTADRGSDDGIVLRPLQPVSGNITQTFYAFGAAAAFISFGELLRRDENLRRFGAAVTSLTVLNCLCAALNLAQFHAGLPDILSFVRTASYAQVDAFEAGNTGLMRISGTFPEASTFATFTLPLFAYHLKLWLAGRDNRWSLALAGAAFLLLLISTSTTAYVGVVAYLGLVGGSAALKVMLNGGLRRLMVLVLIVVLASFGVGCAVVFETDIAFRVGWIIERLVFSKMDSYSGVERAEWNMQAMRNFADTYGLGVGFGSARASSFLVVLLSNLGLFGTVSYGLFVARVLTSAKEPVQLASQHAMVAALIASSLSATVFDMGLAFYAFAAAAATGAISNVTNLSTSERASG